MPNQQPKLKPCRAEQASGKVLQSTALFAVGMPDTRGTYCYLTTGEGDPPRTYTPEHANRYKSERAAKAAMTRARKRTPLKDRFMVVVPHPSN
jgi:hypothetical protein